MNKPYKDVLFCASYLLTFYTSATNMIQRTPFPVQHLDDVFFIKFGTIALVCFMELILDDKSNHNAHA